MIKPIQSFFLTEKVVERENIYRKGKIYNKCFAWRSMNLSGTFTKRNFGV